MREYLSVGVIINTHGVNGELKVYPLTDDMKRFKKLKNVYIDGLEKKVVWCKLQTDKAILKIEGIDTMNDAYKYKNKYIDVKREDAVKLPEGRYFIADLLNCEVFDENNLYLGKIYDVIKTGSNDVYWIKGENNSEVLVPALKNIVVKIDVENSKIIIKPVDTWQ